MGYADSTIQATSKRLRIVSKHVDLNKPELVKAYIALKQCSNGYKQCLVETYDRYVRFNGLTWEKPTYKRYDKMPKIPTEQKINMLIAESSRRLALILSLMKDLKTRPIELTWLKVRDIDLDTGKATITTAKYGSGRTLKMKDNTLAMLKRYITEHNLKQKDRLFFTTSEHIADSYRHMRNRLADKLKDQSIRNIRLYDFRHFGASMTYHKTKDIIYVQKMLGHRKLSSTLKYVQLIDFEADDYHCKAASNQEEAMKLIEAGYEYVTDIDGAKLFRRRK